MGMFDNIWVSCPHCNERTNLQSKAGDCTLEEYELDNAPLSVMGDLSVGGGYRICTKCDREIRVVANGRPTFTVAKPKEPWEV